MTSIVNQHEKVRRSPWLFTKQWAASDRDVLPTDLSAFTAHLNGFYYRSVLVEVVHASHSSENDLLPPHRFTDSTHSHAVALAMAPFVNYSDWTTVDVGVFNVECRARCEVAMAPYDLTSCWTKLCFLGNQSVVYIPGSENLHN